MNTFLKEAKFILLFLGVITVVTRISNIDSDADLQASIRPNLRIKIESEMVDAKWVQRVPAAIAGAEIKPLMLEKDFFCNHSLDENRSNKILKSMVMLNFKLCKKSNLIDKISIVNETNGFKAQIFKSDNSKFKTDYIQLNNGANKIFVEVILKDGQKNVDSLEILSGS